MKNRLFGIMLSAALFAIVGCDNKDNDMTPPKTATPAVMKGTVYVFGDEEEAAVMELGKNVGMYMLKEGTKEVVAAYENIKYQTTSRPVGFLTPEVSDNVLYYPEDGSKVDIVAYYPYKDNMVNNLCPINVADQKSSTNLNFYYAKNGKGLSKSNSKISLEFRPTLSKLTFNLISGDGVKDEYLADATSYISGMNTSADFNLLTASFINPATVKNIDLVPVVKKLSVTGQVLPSPSVNGYKVHLKFPKMADATREVNFTDFTSKNVPLTNLESGFNYIFNVTVSLEKVEITLVKAEPIKDWEIGGSDVSGSGDVELVKSPVFCLPIGGITAGFPSKDLYGYGHYANKCVTSAIVEYDSALKYNVMHYTYESGTSAAWYDSYFGVRIGKPDKSSRYLLTLKMKKVPSATQTQFSFFVKSPSGKNVFRISPAVGTESFGPNKFVTLKDTYEEFSFIVDFSKTTAGATTSSNVIDAVDADFADGIYVGLWPNKGAITEVYLADISLIKK